VRDELNVMDLAKLSDTGELVELSVKANYRELGKVFGKRTQHVATAIAAAAKAGVEAFVDRYRSGTLTAEVDGETVPIADEMVVVAETPRSGWTVASSGADTVALDLELTHELRQLGLLRDIVRLVQEARKNAGLDVTDRIELWWRVGGHPEPAQALRSHTETLAAEVLASAVHEGEPDVNAFEGVDQELGVKIWLRRAES
jgi:isoleucyl-tRNA synthetase